MALSQGKTLPAAGPRREGAPQPPGQDPEMSGVLSLGSKDSRQGEHVEPKHVYTFRMNQRFHCVTTDKLTAGYFKADP